MRGTYFKWSDYDLVGPPMLSLGDYTFKALGLDEDLQRSVNVIKDTTETGIGVRWRLIGYWGIGKSTFVYNLCYQLNELLFFGDMLENPNVDQHRHLLALYVNIPRKRRELLEYTYERGLPVPWEPEETKEIIEKKRRDLLFECLRKLAFLLLRKALHDRRYSIELNVINEKAADAFNRLLEFENIKSSDFVEKIDNLVNEGKMAYSDLAHILRYYIDDLIETTGHVSSIHINLLTDHLPEFLYPVNSSQFLSAFREVLGQYGLGLRCFDVFENICAWCDTFLLLAIDEVEDWSVVVRHKLDLELLDIIVNKPFSIILVFRTEIINRLRRSSVLSRYLTILEHLEDIRIPEMKRKQIIEMTEGILSTARLKRERTLFPLNEEFVVSLAKKTKRAGRFNIRIYIRALTDILERSLSWKRDKVELDNGLLISEEAKVVVSDAIIQEITKEKEIAFIDEKKLSKYAAAADIAYKLLRGEISNRVSLEELKHSIAKQLRTLCPSNMEIIASVEDLAQREKLRRIMENLR